MHAPNQTSSDEQPDVYAHNAGSSNGSHDQLHRPDTLQDSITLYDPEAEYRLLASFLQHPTYLLAVNENLFTGSRVSYFRSMRSAFVAYGTVTWEALRIHGVVPQELLVARQVHPQPLIDYLVSLALKRSLFTMRDQIDKALQVPYLSMDDVYRIVTVPEVYTSRDGSLLDGIHQFIGTMQAKASDAYTYIRTGIPFLDGMLDGEWPRAGLTVIMGQAGGGKTALVCQSSLHMALQRIPVLFFSLEMSKDRLIGRYIAQLTGISAQRIRVGKVSDEERRQVDEALATLQSIPLYVIDDPTLTAHQISFYVQSYHSNQGVQAFFVDYLQIIKGVQSNAMFESLGDITQILRDVARKLSIAAIVLSQQNRQYSGLDALLGSSRIAHTADVVIELKFDTTTTDVNRPTRIIFHKNREGRVGESVCYYRADTLTFI